MLGGEGLIGGFADFAISLGFEDRSLFDREGLRE